MSPGGYRNLSDLVSRAAAARGERAALVAGSRSMTWSEVEETVSRLAGGLRGLGLVPGDRVGIVLGNCVEFPLAWWAALRAGLVAVPLNPYSARPELAHALGGCGVRLVLAGTEVAETIEQLRVELPTVENVITVDPDGVAGDAWRRLLAAEPHGPAIGGGEDLAALVYSSGTTGRPRAAMLPHRALLANVEQVVASVPSKITPHDITLLVIPLFHIYGLSAGLGTVSWAAGTAVLAERFDPAETLRIVRDAGVTIVVGAPPMFVAWAARDDLAESFAAVRLAVSGSAPLPGDVLRRIQEATGSPLFEGYGLTETAPVLATTMALPTGKPDSIGRPVPGVELRLVDSEGLPMDEEEIADGEPGEICVRGPNLFLGYWPDGRDGPDDEGWWRTGDVAYKDITGDLHIVDRRKELILVSGFNVYPSEVEDVLRHHPDIADAVVLGQPHPYTGESVRAVVVPKPGVTTLDPEEVIAWAARSLARFKCPTSVQVVRELPRGDTGKIRRTALRDVNT
jgi:long-chain acyl-CoA synthetase